METESSLSIGGLAATCLAGDYETPLYVYDAEAIRAAFRRIDDAVPHAPRKIHYACVTNSNLAIMRLVRSLGAGIHANTWGDVVMALHAGFEASDVIYTGSNIGRKDMLNLLGHRVAANLNSLSQLSNYGVTLREFCGAGNGSREQLSRVGLRIHLEDQMPYSRMGAKIAELEEARAIAREQGLQIVGVHYYRGTGTVRTDHFLKPFPALMEVARRFGDSLQYVDVGGGFGHQYAPNAPIQFEWEHFGDRFAEMMETLAVDLGRRIMLVLEPGRSLVAESGYLLARVVGVDPLKVFDFLEKRGFRILHLSASLGKGDDIFAYH